MSIDTEAIESTVNLFLSNNFILFKARYMGEDKNNDGWQFDQWKISFRKVGVKKEFTTDFKTGLGCRSKVKKSYIEPKPLTPSAASVINSLMLDISCSTETFPDFCANMGYDTDSIKARDTYHACQEITVNLRAIFSAADIAALLEMTQNY